MYKKFFATFLALTVLILPLIGNGAVYVMGASKSPITHVVKPTRSPKPVTPPGKVKPTPTPTPTPITSPAR